MSGNRDLSGLGVRILPTAPPTSALMAIMLLAVTLVPNGSVRGALDVTTSIALPGEAQRLEGTYPVLVAGIWHDITVVTAQPVSNISITIHSGETAPSNASESNSYRFLWKASGFSDDLYSTWLDQDNSTASGNTYKFRVSVNGSAVTGTWTMKVGANGADVQSKLFKVVPSDVHFGLSTPGFLIRVEPNTPGRYYPTGVGYFRTMNTGNIPLSLELNLNKLGDWIQVTNISTLRAGKELYHYISIDAPAWDIGETFVSGTLTGTPMFYGPREIVGLDPAYVMSISLQVQVGRGGLELKDSGVFALQYPATLAGEYGKSLEYSIYLSGSTEVEVTLEAERAVIKSVIMDGKSVKSPVKVSLVKGTEVHFTLQVRPKEDDTTAKVNYRIVTTNGSITRDYASDMTVPPYNEPPQDPDDGERDRTLAIVFISVAAVATAAVAYTIYEKSRRRRAMELRRKARKGRKRK